MTDDRTALERRIDAKQGGSKPKNSRPKSRPARAPRTIGTNVGQAIKDAMEADLQAKKQRQAAIMAKMAGRK